MTKKDRSLFRIAKDVAEMSDHNYKLGAVIYYKHHIIGSGCNSKNNTDPIQAKLDTNKYGCACPGKLHAESSALLPFIKRRIDISGAEMYIYRKKKSTDFGMARPCSSCMSLIRSCGIRKIHYTTSDGYAEEIII